MTPWLNAFTKQYELQKTLRFSIIPQADTLKYIKEHEVIRKDEIIYQAYKRRIPDTLAVPSVMSSPSYIAPPY